MCDGAGAVGRDTTAEHLRDTCTSSHERVARLSERLDHGVHDQGHEQFLDGVRAPCVRALADGVLSEHLRHGDRRDRGELVAPELAELFPAVVLVRAATGRDVLAGDDARRLPDDREEACAEVDALRADPELAEVGGARVKLELRCATLVDEEAECGDFSREHHEVLHGLTCSHKVTVADGLDKRVSKELEARRGVALREENLSREVALERLCTHARSVVDVLSDAEDRLGVRLAAMCLRHVHEGLGLLVVQEGRVGTLRVRDARSLRDNFRDLATSHRLETGNAVAGNCIGASLVELQQALDLLAGAGVVRVGDRLEHLLDLLVDASRVLRVLPCLEHRLPCLEPLDWVGGSERQPLTTGGREVKRGLECAGQTDDGERLTAEGLPPVVAVRHLTQGIRTATHVTTEAAA